MNSLALWVCKARQVTTVEGCQRRKRCLWCQLFRTLLTSLAAPRHCEAMSCPCWHPVKADRFQYQTEENLIRKAN